MMEEETKVVIIFALGLLMLVSVITGGVYFYHKLEVTNFQATIKDLSDEQKCLHICGFEFDGYLESFVSG
jgi:hypothetical protein